MFIHLMYLKQWLSNLCVGRHWRDEKVAREQCPLSCVFFMNEDSQTGEWWISTEMISDIPEWCPSIVIILNIRMYIFKNH